MHITCHFYFSSKICTLDLYCPLLAHDVSSGSCFFFFFKPTGNFELWSFDPFEVAVVGQCGGVLKLQSSRLI